VCSVRLVPLYFGLVRNNTLINRSLIMRGQPNAISFPMQNMPFFRLQLLLSHICKHSILVIDHDRLLQCRCCRLFKSFVNRIVINVVVAVLDRVELQDKRVADAVLINEVRLLTMAIFSLVLNTCRFSVEISFPPEIDTMYGLSVLGCMHAFFNPKNCAIT
jgi:hypothetical protein